MSVFRSFGIFFIIFLMILPPMIQAQTTDSVDVTFYYKPTGNPSRVYLPGEFNGWSLTSIALMTKDPDTGIWYKTVRLRIGGAASGALKPGAYEYKFNEEGSKWLSDPLNPRTDPNNFSNSVLYVKDPTIHYLLPNSTNAVGEVRTRFPEISAYIFPPVAAVVDTASIVVTLDTLTFTHLGANFDPATHRLSFTAPVPLGDGAHSLKLTARSSTGSQNSDSTTFTVRADLVQILTLPAQTHKTAWRIQGAVFDVNGGFNQAVQTAELLRSDSVWTVRVTNGKVDTTVSLLEGLNQFRLRAVIDNQLQTSQPLSITRIVNHAPYAVVKISDLGGSLKISGAASTDPDGQYLTFRWQERSSNPQSLGIAGVSDSVLTISTPTSDGEYYLKLLVTDSDGLKDSAVSPSAVGRFGGCSGTRNQRVRMPHKPR